jgi:hypothetical protein
VENRGFPISLMNGGDFNENSSGKICEIHMRIYERWCARPTPKTSLTGMFSDRNYEIGHRSILNNQPHNDEKKGEI